MRLHFYLRYHTNFGDSLWVTGNLKPAISGEEPAKLPMQYLNHDFWKLEMELPNYDFPDEGLVYQYVLQNKLGEFIPEAVSSRQVYLAEGIDSIKLYDVWNYAGAFENVFYTAPFKNVLLPDLKNTKSPHSINPTHIFKIKAPLLEKDEVICLLGDRDLLNNWDTSNPILLKQEGDWWTVGLNLGELSFPVVYKYGIYNKKKKAFIGYEQGGNRMCFEPAIDKELIILQDGFINRPNNTWKGAGVSIPVFSLRSKNSFGVGEFNDLHLLVDWAQQTGLKLIQILPVNDTTATGTWHDSYPYAAISAFALHPIYANLADVAGKKHYKMVDGLKRKQKQFNELSDVNYEEVLHFKLAVLKEIFDEAGKDCLQTDDYKQFFDTNKEWLKPYAAFCYLRDKYKTADSHQWKSNVVYKKIDVDRFFHVTAAGLEEVKFYCFVQYHLHLQLKAAVAYAHKKGIILKGDIPIGVYRYGCDAWVSPELFKMDMQAGAPPDDFAARGQNWSFPTYNWKQMQADGFAWWKQRFEQMSDYFDAFRIDHILGFFRIWSIPVHSVQGIMGKFDPCLPVHINEFGENGIWFDYERFCSPFINDHVLYQLFGDRLEEVKHRFLQRNGPENYALLPDFDTQRKIENHFKNLEDNEGNRLLWVGLYELVSNIILFEEAGSDRKLFHFRIVMEQTLSFQALMPHVQEKLRNLYVDYFFKRQNEFWRQRSLEKLPGLKAATNMLICGEDLGMVPDCVPDVMAQLGILSLEIQRMPKDSGKEFFNLTYAPYLSVVTPSTHDMSTIRGWWQENREATQRFYNNMLGQGGEAPYFCEPWISRAIILQHLYSPAMWSIFQMQDLLGMSATLRREMPEDERINIPANPEHYWRYRMHLNLEQLLKEKEFNTELLEYVQNSGR